MWGKTKLKSCVSNEMSQEVRSCVQVCGERVEDGDLGLDLKWNPCGHVVTFVLKVSEPQTRFRLVRKPLQEQLEYKV
jgi:hypothetical protein